MIMKTHISILCLILHLLAAVHAYSQGSSSRNILHEPSSFLPYQGHTMRDLPELKLPEYCKNQVLPAVLDNSLNPCFAGISDQKLFASCQQHHSVSYVFGYEINRLRGLDGKLPRNFYPSHFTFNFFNNANWDIGVSYFHSLDVLMSQGQMTGSDYGVDQLMDDSGWPTGYDKYYNGMHNRLAKAYTIPMNTEEGQNTLKHYLYDHLEESPTGGVALFSATSPYGPYLRSLPPGTPEADKPVIIFFDWFAVHGGTIVGYNDSIRYDINNDGQYTNDVDINNDGKVDLLDWEIGGFRVANSYGAWWGDQGFYYVLYSAMAHPYGAGGVQNTNVVILEPMADYQPRLTMKLSFKTSCRSHYRFRAGVSADTSMTIPEHEIDFPIFNFQGNCLGMQGFDSIPGNDSLETGLDVTPLLSYVEPGAPSRFFLIVDNLDSLSNLGGEILNLAFINYTPAAQEFTSPRHNIPCIRDGSTYASVVLDPAFDKLRITTPEVPSFVNGQAYQQQLQYAGGMPPVRWSETPSFNRIRTDSVFNYYPGSSPSMPPVNKPYVTVALPFSFPFLGKQYDTLWMNTLGLVCFDNVDVPYFFTCDDLAMLKSFAGIFPAYTRKYFSGQSYSDSMHYSLSPSKAVFRWFMKVNFAAGSITNNVELILYPDGKYEVRYGSMSNPTIDMPFYTGWSAGDGICYEIEKLTNRSSFGSQSFAWVPSRENGVFHISESGLLTAQTPDSSLIYTVHARVEDANHMHDEKIYQVSNGLGLSYSFADGWDGNLKFGDPVSMNLTVSNRTAADMQNLRLSLSCSDASIIFTDSSRSISLLPAGNTRQFDHAFSFRLAAFLPDQRSAHFRIQASTSNRTWYIDLALPVSAPDIEIPKPDVVDGDNHFLDPGEVAELEVSIINLGHAGADSLFLDISSADTLVKVISDPAAFIPSLLPGEASKPRFLLKASRYANASESSILSIRIRGINIPEKNVQFSLLHGRKPLALARLSSESVSLKAMETALDSLKIPYTEFTHTSFDPNEYNAVFLLNGTTFAEHILTNYEGQKFASYLDHGGKLYMEGNAIWTNASPLDVLPYFRYTSSRVPAFFYQRLKGVSSAFSKDMNFSYEHTINGSVYDLNPADSSFASFTNTAADPKSIQICYKGEGYSTIASLFEFGAIVDSASPCNQKDLMQGYLDFFNISLSGPFPFFHASKTSCTPNDTLTFLNDSYPAVTTWSWEFPGGTPAVSSEPDPVVSYKAMGTYDATLTVSDGSRSKTLTRRNYISVTAGTGISEPLAGKLSISPNPAKDKIQVRFPGITSTKVQIEIYDIRGLQVLSATAEPITNSQLLNISSLSPGMYIIKALSDAKQYIGKLIVK